MKNPHQNGLPSSRCWVALDSESDPPKMGWRQKRRVWSAPLDNLLGRRGYSERLLRGQRFLALMPARYCMYRVLTPPALGHRRINRLLPGMLDLALPFSVEQCETRFTLFREPLSGTQKALALAVRHADIDAHLSGLQKRGLNPQLLLPEPWVIWRHAQRIWPEADASALKCIRLRHAHDHTLIVGRGANLLATATAPGNAAAGLFRLLIQAHERTGQTSRLLLDIGLEPSPEPPVPATLLTVPDPENWRLCAMLDSLGSQALAQDLRLFHNSHPIVPDQRRKTAYGLAAVLVASALVTSATHVFSRRHAENRLRLARTTLQERLNDLAGYTVTRRGADALDAVREALDARILPAIEALSGPLPLPLLQTCLVAAGHHGVSLHEVTWIDPGWRLRATAPSVPIAHAFVNDLRHDNHTVKLTFPLGESVGDDPVTLLLSIRSEP